jgi:hypothetical protein
MSCSVGRVIPLAARSDWANAQPSRARSSPAAPYILRPLSRKRRNHALTVSIGTPSKRDVRRAPAPAAKNRHALPMTATESRRRTRTSAGSTTWVTPHPPHRTRLGWKRQSPADSRTTRDRAWPHLARFPPQPGHERLAGVTRSATDWPGSNTMVIAHARIRRTARRPWPGGPGCLILRIEPRVAAMGARFEDPWPRRTRSPPRSGPG